MRRRWRQVSRADDWLVEEFEARHRRVAGVAADTPDVTAPVVLRGFDPAAVVAGAVRFAAGLSPAEASSWLACYTRSLFLVGNPANLVNRYPCRTLAPDGSVGWLGLYDRCQVGPLRRLLRPMSGKLPTGLMGLDTVVGDGGRQPAGWRLAIAVRGLDVPSYLIHLHHIVTEAVLAGALREGSAVALRHVPSLDPVAVRRGGPISLRVHYASDHSTALRLYAALTPVPARRIPTRSAVSQPVVAGLAAAQRVVPG